LKYFYYKLILVEDFVIFVLLMAKVSIFSREFKRTFNANKYMNYTDRTQNAHTHLPFYSKKDMFFGRTVFTLAFSALALTMYHDPGYIHETFGHIKGVEKPDAILDKLSGEEKLLNEKIIARQAEENKMEHYISVFKSYD